MSSGGVQGDHFSRYTDNDAKRIPWHYKKSDIACERLSGYVILIYFPIFHYEQNMLQKSNVI